jgi:hypothetical protein
MELVAGYREALQRYSITLAGGIISAPESGQR